MFHGEEGGGGEDFMSWNLDIYLVCLLFRSLRLVPSLQIKSDGRMADMLEHIWWPSSFDTVDKRYFTSLMPVVPASAVYIVHVTHSVKDEEDGKKIAPNYSRMWGFSFKFFFALSGARCSLLLSIFSMPLA